MGGCSTNGHMTVGKGGRIGGEGRGNMGGGNRGGEGRLGPVGWAIGFQIFLSSAR